MDVTALGLDFPPRPTGTAKLGAYRRTVEQLVSWADHCLNRCRYRSTPLLSFDLSDGLGSVEEGGLVNRWPCSQRLRLHRASQGSLLFGSLGSALL